MALKDLKSELSKFRLPKKDPLETKPRVNVAQTQNQTPLSDMVESAPKIPRSTTTTNKEGVNPKKMDNSEKFLGETSPQPMDNSEKFKGETSPKPMSLEQRYLGETNPSKMDNSEQFLGETTPTPSDTSEKFLGETNPSKMDNSENFLGETTQTPSNRESKFLGETNPSKMDNSEQFLGETNPKPMSLEERYLGETTPTGKDSTGQFLGETNPNIVQQGDKFKGETTTESVSQGDKFKGETDPNKFDNSSNFVRFSNEQISSPLATEPTQMNLDAKFLGETTPNPSDASSKFLGETTPNPMNIPNGEKLLGETTPTPKDSTGQFLGETTTTPISQGDKNKGETTPSDFTFNGKLENEGKDFKEVNYFSDIHATGFTSKFGGVEATKFVGVNPNNTVFDTTTSKYGNFGDSFEGLDSAPGYGKYKLLKQTKGSTQRYNPDKKYYVDSTLSNKGISELQEMRNSPSFLDEMYSKFNLKEDAFNRGLGLFRQPFILRGIQRKKIDKGEPQVWGLGGFNYDEGAIRGGIVTSTVRALIDVARIGSWFASVPGVLWGAKQFGMQRTNKFGKLWTPANMLASIGGQHIGFKPDRSGVIGLDVTGKYSKPLIGGYKDKINTIYTKDVFGPLGTITGLPFLTQTDARGGFDSIYGIGTTLTSRFENTFSNAGKDFANKAALFTQVYEPLNKGAWNTPITPDKFNTYNDDLPIDEDEAQRFGVAGIDRPEVGSDSYSDGLPQDTDEAQTFGLAGIDRTGGGSNSLDANGNTNGDVPGAEVIKDYETIAYGNIPERVAGTTSNTNDFRSYLSDENSNKKIADSDNYSNFNINTRVNFGTPGKMGPSENRYEWWNLSKDTEGNTERFDKVNAAGIGDDTVNDLVHLLFDKVDGGGSEQIQFRGAVSGITDTFSPSWDSFKYNGRADQAYKYSSFERSLSFNIQVYATSRVEMVPIWQKLARLASMTMPEYSETGAGYNGVLLDFTLGSLYKKEIVFIESLSYTMSDETPWEISMLGSKSSIGELPMGVDVSIGLKVLGRKEPHYGQPFVYGAQ